MPLKKILAIYQNGMTLFFTLMLNLKLKKCLKNQGLSKTIYPDQGVDRSSLETANKDQAQKETSRQQVFNIVKKSASLTELAFKIS